MVLTARDSLTDDWRVGYPPEIRGYRTKAELLHALAIDFLELAAARQQSGKRFSVLMGGGRTPVELNRCIIEFSQSQSCRLDWHQIEIWFTDERCVPPGHRQT